MDIPGLLVTVLVMFVGNGYEVADGCACRIGCLEVLSCGLWFEKLLPSRSIEEFLRLVVDGDSALGLLSLMGRRVAGLKSFHILYANHSA